MNSISAGDTTSQLSSAATQFPVTTSSGLWQASDMPDQQSQTSTDKAGGVKALAGSESEKIAQMAENTQPVRRGDGTILQERGDIPKNPKKKTLEPEPPKDEL